MTVENKIFDDLKQQVSEAVTELRQKTEEFGADSAEAKLAAEKTEAKINEFEEKNQKLVLEVQAEKKAAEELKERVKTVESALSRSRQIMGGKAWKEEPKYKALEKYIMTGSDAELKALNMTDATEGGYLAPEEMSSELIKKITEISPVRQLARVQSTSKILLTVPKRESIPDAYYEGESESNQESNSGYGNETLVCHRLSARSIVTDDLIMDAAFDMEAQMFADMAEQFAKKEGNKFVLGTGVKQPEGFAANAALQAAARETATTGTLAADDLLSLTGDLKEGYNPVFGFNRATLSTIRKFKGSTNDHYLWQMGLAPDAPATIAGDPYVVLQDMAGVSSGNYAVVYADFFRGYRIVDRTALRAIRDQYTRAQYAQIVINWHRWNHGQVVLEEAFKLLKIKS